MNEAPGAQSSSPEKSRRGGRILIVDDQEVLLRWARSGLEREGYTVICAASLQEGLDMLREEFDVGVFDVDLGDGQGFTLVESLRKTKASLVPIIMITGNPNQESVGRSVSHGITEFLFKPFQMRELSEAVERAFLAKQRWEKRLETLRDEGRLSGRAEGTLGGARLARLGAVDISRILDDLTQRGKLTGRERETLALMLAGLQNADIAERLEISANTVKYHVRNVLTKLRMSSRTDLFRSLLAQGETR